MPFYYRQDRLCSMVKSGSAKMLDLRSAILNAGYRVSLSHAHKLSIKTDAPNEFIFDMLKAWEKLNPINRDNILKESVAWALLNRESKHEVAWFYNWGPISNTNDLKLFITGFVRDAPQREPGIACQAA